jgi:hypothetical protein
MVELAYTSASNTDAARLEGSTPSDDTMETIEIGDKVEKVTGDYKFKGTVVSKFQKLSGVVRFVVENEDGILHIFSQTNLKKQDGM